MKVLLIIPAYNEEGNILNTIEKVKAFAAQKTGYELRYIVINDGSSDGTRKVCLENQIETIHLLENLGIGGAVQTGYMLAEMQEYDVAVQFDGDGQHDITYLDKLLAPILAGKADFTIGSRFIDDCSDFRSTALRRFGIRFLSAIIRMFSGAKSTDPTSGFRAATKPVISLLAKHYPADYPEPESLVEIAKHGFTIREVPVNMLEREDGISSIRAWKSVYYMIKVSIAIVCVSMQRKVK